MTSIEIVENVLMNHIYTYPICDNLVRLNDYLLFEHETKLSSGTGLLIIYRYDPKNGLTAHRIFDRAKLQDETDKYKNHPDVQATIRLLEEEIRNFKRPETIIKPVISRTKNS